MKQSALWLPKGTLIKLHRTTAFKTEKRPGIRPKKGSRFNKARTFFVIAKFFCFGRKIPILTCRDNNGSFVPVHFPVRIKNRPKTASKNLRNGVRAVLLNGSLTSATKPSSFACLPIWRPAQLSHRLPNRLRRGS